MLRRLVAQLGFKAAAKPADPAMNSDGDFPEILAACSPYTMTSKERMYALYKSVQYVVKAGILGDFVECGVWRGGSAMLMAKTLLSMGVTDRTIFLYDTFEGMSAPSDADKDFTNQIAQTLLDATTQTKETSVWCLANIGDVQRNMASTKYPAEKIIYVKGKVEDTLPTQIPRAIGLLRLDTDWYESTKHELIHLYPLLQFKGVLIIDDYGHWQGCKQAVDEYFCDKPILLSRVDYTGRVAVKA